METRLDVPPTVRQSTKNHHRNQLLIGLPVTEHFRDLAGLNSAVLEGGEGPPIVLLHGPGETALWWMRVIPDLVDSHRVIAPDLPGHGASIVDDQKLDPDFVIEWLANLVEDTCLSPPVLVGHLLGGAIAARFSSRGVAQIDRLVLVDSLGIGKFRPAPAFAFRLVRFLFSPTRKNYNRFLPHCVYDATGLRRAMGDKWEPFIEYNVHCATDSSRQAALRSLMREMGIPQIPEKDLARIDVPTALVWGRHDLANRLPVAEAASERFGWPLHVIDNARDDPKLERPDAFVSALRDIING